MLGKCRGGGYLEYLSDGKVPFCRVSFSLIFSRTGYQKKVIFLELVVKTCQKGNFVRSAHYLVQFLCFGVNFHQFFLEIVYHFQAKTLEPGEGRIFRGHIPVQI